MMEANYKQIGNIKVGDDGSVISPKRGFNFGNECSRGYRKTRVNGKTKYIHRLVAEAFIPNPYNLPNVNHKNGLKFDNRVSNLEWCTQSYNIQHAYNSGLKTSRGVRGVNHYKAILTEDAVIDIFKSKEVASVLAKRYNTSESNIYEIKHRRTWTHITDTI